jgi:hypothetical protein
MRGSYAANSSPFTTLADMNHHPFYFSKLGNPPRNKASIAETKFPVNSFFLFEGSFLSGLSRRRQMKVFGPAQPALSTPFQRVVKTNCVGLARIALRFLKVKP